jgi:acyl-CoA synthetase (AMP-forming)/AMP-acid ligase II
MAELASTLAARLQGRVHLLMFGGVAPGFESYEALRDAQPATPMFNRRRGASMLYSSGTTGRPKGVRTPLLDVPATEPPIRHRLLVNMFNFAADMVFVNPGPFYHAAPLRMMMSVQRLGGVAVGFRKFDPVAVLAAIDRYQGTHGFFVPTMFVRMLRLAEAERNRFSLASMRYAIHGAAPCPAYLKESLMQWWGDVLYELYGGTEGIGHTFISPQEWLRKKGSVGKAAKGCVIRIVDDAGNTLPANEPGLIYMGNGREFEYFKDDDKTAEVRGADGLATMGDIGYLDEDGYLFLSDRQSHMIISGGVNIYPQESENILAAHPAIEDVAVIGVPNDEFGEEVKAIVVPIIKQFDRQQLEGEILAYCRSHISAIKCPRSVDFVDQLPRSEAGKLLKRQIKAPYWAGRQSQII